jgi:hypothetical protein
MGFVATCDHDGSLVSANAAADNARIIAACPDLLEALRNLVREFSAYENKPEFSSMTELRSARAALAKATGEQP